jgi:glycosyltransferase involved in cell wall biosynthesis
LRFLGSAKRVFTVNLSAIGYLLKNASNVGVLQLYHISVESAIYALLFRFLNPKALLYVKADLDVRSFSTYRSLQLPANSLVRVLTTVSRRLFQWTMVPMLLDACTFISVETSAAHSLLTTRFPRVAHKITLLPSGVSDWVADQVALLPATDRDKTILTVGRIGAPEKNHEMLVRAMERITSPDWTCRFVGPVDPAFSRWVEARMVSNPTLREKVILSGPIDDRRQLYQVYSLSSIFCLTSLRESFGLAMVEAAYFGNVIVSTRVPAAVDLTGNGRAGVLVDFDDDRSLASALSGLIASPRRRIELSSETTRIARSSYSWSSIVDKLHSMLYPTGLSRSGS